MVFGDGEHVGTVLHGELDSVCVAVSRVFCAGAVLEETTPL